MNRNNWGKGGLRKDSEPEQMGRLPSRYQLWMESWKKFRNIHRW